MADTAWLFQLGAWTKIENPLPNVHGEVGPWPPYDSSEYRRRITQNRAQRRERLEQGGYKPYPWLDLGVETYLTADVYVADPEARDPAPHEFYVHLDQEGNGFHLFATDLPSLLQLLSLLSSIGSWDLASVLERDRQERVREDRERDDEEVRDES
jgi:hypothetical protein